MERMTGIEPALPAWEAGALPLDDIRKACSAYHIRGENSRGEMEEKSESFSKKSYTFPQNVVK